MEETMKDDTALFLGVCFLAVLSFHWQMPITSFVFTIFSILVFLASLKGKP